MPYRILPSPVCCSVEGIVLRYVRVDPLKQKLN